VEEVLARKLQRLGSGDHLLLVRVRGRVRVRVEVRVRIT